MLKLLLLFGNFLNVFLWQNPVVASDSIKWQETSDSSLSADQVTAWTQTLLLPRLLSSNTQCVERSPQFNMDRTYAGFTRSLLALGDAGLALVQRLPAGHLQLAHVTVGSPVAAADLVADLALTQSLGQPLARRVLALQPVAARQLVLAAAGLALALGAHQAAVAVVRHVAAGAAGARAAAHVAPCGTCGFGLRAGRLVEVEEHSYVQEKQHVQSG